MKIKQVGIIPQTKEKPKEALKDDHIIKPLQESLGDNQIKITKKEPIVENQIKLQPQKPITDNKVLNKQGKTRSGNIVLLIIAGFLVLVIAGLLVYYFFLQKENNSIKTSNGTLQEEKIYIIKTSNDEIKFEMKDITRNKCYGDSSNCSFASLHIVNLLNGKNSDNLNVIINNKLLEFINNTERKSYSRPEDVLDDFVNNCKFNCHDQYFDTLEKINDRIFCVRFDNDVETGNHPYFTSHRINIDFSNLALINVNDIFIPNFKNKLNTMLNAKYLDYVAENNLGTEYLNNYSVILNNNFQLSKDSIIFEYEDGEIVKILHGPIDLAFNFNELNDILNQSFADLIGYHYEKPVIENNSNEVSTPSEKEDKQSTKNKPIQKTTEEKTNPKSEQTIPNKPKTIFK